MDTKLTLKLDRDVIEHAKQYAKTQNISLSRLIESYLAALTKGKQGVVTVSPLVESLTGVVNLDDLHEKKDYGDYLAKKYG